MMILRDDEESPVFDHNYDAVRYAQNQSDMARHRRWLLKNRWLQHTFDTACAAFLGAFMAFVLTFTNQSQSNYKFASIMALSFAVFGVLCVLANWIIRVCWKLR
jgi:hypothetical protein